MNETSIVANHKSEERYTKLSLAYSTPEEKAQIEAAIQKHITECTLEPTIYSGAVTGGKHMITLEYHDDCDRDGGKVYENILCSLGIKECH